jgi:chromosome condensin MukBEF ATPase and DNA-binding subunit MukB
MVNLAKNIKRLVSLKKASSNIEDLILQKQSLEATTDVLLSPPINIASIDSLNESIMQWRRKEEKLLSLTKVINRYTFMHIVDILQLYEGVKECKEQIQRISKYKPKKRNSTKGWINHYLADKLQYSSRQITRYLTAAKRLKSLYDRGISYDILVLSKCFLSDFWCTEKTYTIFLNELNSNNNNIIV